MSSEEMLKLQRGDLVKSKFSHKTYVVTGNYGDRITAVATVNLTNPEEWDTYPPKPLEVNKMSSTKWLRLAYYEIFQVSQALKKEQEIKNDVRINMLRIQCSNIEATLYTKLTKEEREQALTEGINATN